MVQIFILILSDLFTGYIWLSGRWFEMTAEELWKLRKEKLIEIRGWRPIQMKKLINWLKEPFPQRKNIVLTVYEIKTGREIFNASLHVALGGVVSYAWIPDWPLWPLITILLLLGIVREWYQWYRGKVQPKYIQIIDVLTIGLGGAAYYISPLKGKADKL